MNTGFALVILGEVALFLFLVYGFMHEDKFIAFEDAVIAAVKQKYTAKKRAKAAAQRRRINEKVRYTPERPVRRSASGNKAA